MTTITEPGLHVVIEWRPIGPERWEATWGPTVMIVDWFGAGPLPWRWRCFSAGGTMAGGHRRLRSQAMLHALEFAGHPNAHQHRPVP